MRTWARRTFGAVGAIVLVVALLLVTLLILFRSAPAWYVASTTGSEQAASDAENKLILAQNWAQELRADEVRAARVREGQATTSVAPRAAESMTIALSQTEINALFEKWSVLYGWKGKYSEFVEAPQVILRDGRVILAGKVKDLGTVLSFQFQPAVDANHRLRLDLVRVMGGKLPLPDSVWTSWRDKMLLNVNRQLPVWRRHAKIEPTGAANVPAMAAAMGELLRHVARREPGEALLFLPLADGGKSVPVKVRAARVEGEQLMLDVEPMNASERGKLLERIRVGGM